MACYFIVWIDIEHPGNRTTYDQYTERVRPIVERYGGRYLVRSELIETFAGGWHPDRVIVIRFDDREALGQCFASPEYREIMDLRIQSVTTRAIITEGF
ncbi:MAG: DUF1330 domain-containing protein [Rikenellaceae bacterium]|nr:DUF1330 domain-containing protein [Rikenellaceae bacterium]